MMRTVKLSAILVVFGCVLLVNGCNSEMQDLRIQNSTQQKRIDQLQAELSANMLQLEQMKNQLATAGQKGGIPAEKASKIILKSISKKKKEVLVGGKDLIMVYLKRFFPGIFWRIIHRVSPT